MKSQPRQSKKKIEKIVILEPRPSSPNLLVNILELSDKVNEIIEIVNSLQNSKV